LVGHDTHSPAVNSGIAGDDGLPEAGLVFFKFRIVHEALDDLHHVVLLVPLLRKNAIDLLWVLGGFHRRLSAIAGLVKVPDLVHYVLDGVEGILVVLGLVIRHAADLGMSGGPPKGLIVYGFADGGFHQVATRKEDASGLVDYQSFITHDGQIGPSGHAAAHYGSDLGDPHA